jgi:hypothetical protein
VIFTKVLASAFLLVEVSLGKRQKLSLPMLRRERRSKIVVERGLSFETVSIAEHVKASHFGISFSELNTCPCWKNNIIAFYPSVSVSFHSW